MPSNWLLFVLISNLLIIKLANSLEGSEAEVKYHPLLERKKDKYQFHSSTSKSTDDTKVSENFAMQNNSSPSDSQSKQNVDLTSKENESENSHQGVEFTNRISNDGQEWNRVTPKNWVRGELGKRKKYMTGPSNNFESKYGSSEDADGDSGSTADNSSTGNSDGQSIFSITRWGCAVLYILVRMKIVQLPKPKKAFTKSLLKAGKFVAKL